MQSAVMNPTLTRPSQSGQNNFASFTAPKQNGHLQDHDEIPVALLSDEEVLTLCHLQMTAEQHEEVSDLLFDQREGMIDEAGGKRLDQLLQIYDQYMLRKSEYFVVAVQRGLNFSLSEDYGVQGLPCCLDMTRQSKL